MGSSATVLPARRPTGVPLALQVAVLIVVLAGVAFRFYHLDRKVFWEDEIFGTVHTLGYTEADIVNESGHMRHASDIQAYFRLPGREGTRAGLAATVRSLQLEDPQHPPAYYLLAHLWIATFGSSVSAIRSLAALCGVVVLPCVFLLALELFGSYAIAWVALALVAVSPFQILYSQEAREYTLWTVAIALTSVAFLRAWRSASSAWWCAYAVALAISLYVYPLSAFVACGHGLFLLSVRPFSRAALVRFAASFGAALLAFAPWAVVMLRSPGLSSGMAGILSARLSPSTIVAVLLRNLRNVFVDIGRFKLGPLGASAVNVGLSVLVVALVAYAMYDVWRRAPRSGGRFALIALAFPALPLVLHDLLSGGHIVDQSRYFIPLYLSAQLCVAALIGATLFDGQLPVVRRTASATAFGALVAGGLLSCAVSSQAPTWWNKDYEDSRDVAAVVNRSPNPVVVSDFHTSRILGLAYYLDPAVALRLDLRCDQCSVRTPGTVDLLADTGRFETVFLLGPSSNLAHAAERSSGVHRSEYETIDVAAFPAVAPRLGLFLKI